VRSIYFDKWRSGAFETFGPEQQQDIPRVMELAKKSAGISAGVRSLILAPAGFI